jgi:hypothetical protein
LLIDSPDWEESISHWKQFLFLFYFIYLFRHILSFIHSFCFHSFNFPLFLSSLFSLFSSYLPSPNSYDLPDIFWNRRRKDVY